jgi:hypothetical protein
MFVFRIHLPREVSDVQWLAREETDYEDQGFGKLHQAHRAPQW